MLASWVAWNRCGDRGRERSEEDEGASLWPAEQSQGGEGLTGTGGWGVGWGRRVWQQDGMPWQRGSWSGGQRALMGRGGED